MEQYPDISYKSIDTLPYFNFTQVLKTNDLQWLGPQENKSETWLNIQDEYCLRAKVDNSNIKQQSIVLGLERKYNYIAGCLEILRHSYLLQDFEEFKLNHDLVIKKLSMFGYLVNGRKDFESEFDRLLNQLSGLKMKITIESKKIEKNNNKQGVNLWRELTNLQNVVPNVPINPYNDPVAKVIEVQNLAKQIINEQRNNRSNRRR